MHRHGSRLAIARTAAAAAASLLVLVPAVAGAQHVGHGAAAPDPAAVAAHEAMGHGGHAGHAAHHPHMRMTPARTATAVDSARAAAVERALLPVLALYTDVRAAERDGFELFAPQVKTQRVYHFTNRRDALRAAFGFDAARPTSLLYTKNAAGDFVLAGAMYTAPARASLDALNARVPLGLAAWHQHVAICVPKLGDAQRWTETVDGQPRFGPAGAIATEPACDAANGRWHERIFGWMVHATLVRDASGKAHISWADEH